jgi:hypothetical protein
MIPIVSGVVEAVGLLLGYRPRSGQPRICGRARSTRLKMRLDDHARRFGAVLLPDWRMMGALETADGMLLFGISTPFWR